MIDQLGGAESFPEFASRPTTIIRRSPSKEDVLLNGVHQRLRASGYQELRSLACEYHEGMLILRGRLSSHFLKQLGQEAVRTQPGVKMIVNAIEVVTPRPEASYRDESV